MLAVLGNYEQQASATLMAEIRPSDNTSLAVQGEAAIAGMLVVEVPQGEQPDGAYQVLIADSISQEQGRLDLVYARGLPAGKIALVDYGAVRGRNGTRSGALEEESEQFCENTGGLGVPVAGGFAIIV